MIYYFLYIEHNMSGDNYVFSKSEAPQGFDLESPFVSKQYNFVNDINSGVYSSSGLSLVQFDLSSIYNSAGFLSPSEMYVTIPVCYTAAYSTSTTTGALVAPVLGDWAQCGLKCGFWNLISSADLVVDGKPLESYQPNMNAYVGFKLLSQMSQDDLAGFGMTLGMGKALDNPQSVKFNNTASASTTGAFPLGTGPIGGNGLSNNIPFAIANPDAGDQPTEGVQSLNSYNAGYFSRLNRVVDLTAGAGSTNLYNSNNAGTGIMSTTQCLNEFRPVYQILNTSYACWQDIAIVRMKDLFDSMKQFPLVKKFDAQLRLYINVGSVGVQIGATGTMMTSQSVSTFTNTCPLMISTLTGTYPASAISLVAGLSIARAAPTSVFGGINLALSGSANPLTSCRVYYPMVELKPERAISYTSENRAKKVCYTSILSNTYNAITSGSTFSTLVQSGVQRIRGVLIIPFLAGSTNGQLSATTAVTGITSFSPLLSPFDCAPMQTGPISLINLNVAVGGRNVLQNSLQYTYQDWLEQVSNYEKIASGDLGLSCGLLSQYAWENASRFYYIDCTRGTQADGATLRNLTVTFNNNCLQTIDCLIFTEYFSECQVDVADGRIKM